MCFILIVNVSEKKMERPAAEKERSEKIIKFPRRNGKNVSSFIYGTEVIDSVRDTTMMQREKP